MNEVFTAQALRNARNIQQQGQVLNLKLGGGLVKAWVRSVQGNLLDIYLDLRVWPETAARCRCKSLGHCEHAAACLYELQSRMPGYIAPELENQLEDEFYFTDLDAPEGSAALNKAKLLRSSVPVGQLNKPARLQIEDVLWYSEVQEQKNDFFEYQLGIIVEDKRVNILPLVIEKLQQMDRAYWEEGAVYQQPFIITLPNQKKLLLPAERLKILIEILLATGRLQGSPEKSLQLLRYQLLLVQEAELALKATQARWQGTEAIRQSLQSLMASDASSGIDAFPPVGLQAVLRPYQEQGIFWLQSLRKQRFGGVLADDMGLGKTIQTLTHLLYEKEQQRLTSPCLIIAPMSLLHNWLEEGKRFTPGLRMVIYHGTKRKHINFKDYDIILSTYGLIQRSKEVFDQQFFYYIILDEAQWIKNSRTLTAQKIQQLKGAHRLCLTGTPVENHLGELWSLFHFLMPGLLGTARDFHRYFRKPIESQQNDERRRLLSGRVSPFLLRRTKTQVLTELPSKTQIIQTIALSGKQRDLYEAIRLTMESRVREELQRFGLTKSRWIILDALLKLRQVCCDPRLVKLPNAEIAYGSSAKLEALLNLLATLLSENRRVLIFSQFTSMLSLIEEALNKHKYGYVKLTGKITSSKERQRLIDLYQTGDIPIFLLSLKAGGVGINLTRADTVIHYDPWWNPAVEEQATSRSHRIGQTQPVFVYKLITEGTVEAVIQQMQEKKKTMIDDVFAGKQELTEDLLADFFQPLV